MKNEDRDVYDEIASTMNDEMEDFLRWRERTNAPENDGRNDVRNDDLLQLLADNAQAMVTMYEDGIFEVDVVEVEGAQIYSQNSGIVGAITAFYKAVEKVGAYPAELPAVRGVAPISRVVSNAISITYTLRQLAAAEFSESPLPPEVVSETLAALPEEAATFFIENMSIIEKVRAEGDIGTYTILAASLLRRLEAYIYTTLYIQQLFEALVPITDFAVYTENVYNSGFDLLNGGEVFHIDPKKG